MTHALTIKTEIHNCNISAIARSFGETDRPLVICMDFTVALVLRVGAVGDGDVLVFIFIVLRKQMYFFGHVTYVYV